MNNQFPMGFYPNNQTFPGVNDFNQPIEYKLNEIDNRLKNLEDKIKMLEEQLNKGNTNYNPYQSSMHMM